MCEDWKQLLLMTREHRSLLCTVLLSLPASGGLVAVSEVQNKNHLLCFLHPFTTSCTFFLTAFDSCEQFSLKCTWKSCITNSLESYPVEHSEFLKIGRGQGSLPIFTRIWTWISKLSVTRYQNYLITVCYPPCTPSPLKVPPPNMHTPQIAAIFCISTSSLPKFTSIHNLQ